MTIKAEGLLPFFDAGAPDIGAVHPNMYALPLSHLHLDALSDTRALIFLSPQLSIRAFTLGCTRRLASRRSTPHSSN